jgi:hypothetical protein
VSMHRRDPRAVYLGVFTFDDDTRSVATKVTAMARTR